MVHPEVATLDGMVSGEEVREVRVAVEVKKGELMMGDEWFCEWEKKTEGGRWRGGVPYSPLEQTWHVLTPTWLSRSLLRPSTLSIRSRTCVPTGGRGGVRSFRSHILLRLLLNWAAELGSSSRGPCFLCMV